MPFEEEYDFPGFILTHSRLDALIRTLEKLSLVLPLYRGTPQPAGLQSFIASLREVAFGQNSLNYVETTKNMLTNSLISA
jgi:hypothetical protein